MGCLALWNTTSDESFHSDVQSTAKLFENLRLVGLKSLYAIQFCKINICQVIIFRLHIVYNKHEMIKIDSQIREKSQVLLQVLE